MNIQLMSDLHFEFPEAREKKFIEELDPSGVDVLILAGDIGYIPNLEDAFKSFCVKYPHVVYVPGNHEYYKSTAAIADEKLQMIKIPNFHLLDSSHITIEGQRFIGGTMWFAQPSLISSAAHFYKKDMNDFNLIKEFEPWVYEKNRVFQTFMEQELHKDDVVVTHHLPSQKSISPRHERDVLNAFFMHDMERLIAKVQPKLWVHGHTHDACDYRLGDTRVICNPRGYPKQWPSGQDFKMKLVVTV